MNYKRYIKLLAGASLVSVGGIATTQGVSADQVDSWTIGEYNRPNVSAVDVSSWQGDLTQENFNELKKNGIEHAVVKATESNNYINPSFSDQINKAHNAGMSTSTYHYGQFTNENQAQEEANYYANTLDSQNIAKNSMVILDIEEHKMEVPNVVDNVRNFFDTLTTRGYTNQGIYTFKNFKYFNELVDVLGNDRVWVAQYPYHVDSNSKWNSQYGAWQLSSTAYINGYRGSLDVSLDYKNFFSRKDPVRTGEVYANGNWYFVNPNGTLEKGFKYLSDGNKTVFYDESGKMQHGQKFIDGYWYLFDNNNGSMKTGFQYLSDGNKTVFYNNKGQMLYGAHIINGKKCVFDGVTGALLKSSNVTPNESNNIQNENKKQGFYFDKNKKITVYYGEDGHIKYGQQKINGNWYLFDSNTGAMKTGIQYISDENKTVFYDSQGKMQYGQVKIGEKYYYFDLNNGAQKTGFINYNGETFYFNTSKMYGQQCINGNWYLFDVHTGAMKKGFQYIPEESKICFYDNSGIMLHGPNKVNGTLYNFDWSTGALCPGWSKYANEWYYFNSKGKVETGQQYINGHWYLLDSNTGVMKTGFQYVSDGQKICYYNQEGMMQYGQQNINGHWYLFDNVTGAMKTGFQYIPENNKVCFYNENGRMAYGVVKVNGELYNLHWETGALVSGWGQYKDQWYYFNSKGKVETGQQYINGHWYLLDSHTGVMKTGFQYIPEEKKTVYYNNNGQMLYGTQKINGKNYTFDNITGALLK